MTVETFMRIFFGTMAVVVAILLILELATGRSGFGARTQLWKTDPRSYWGAVGMSVILLLTCILAAVSTGPPNTPAILIGVLGAQLFQILVSGKAHYFGRVATRASDPGLYRRRVATHGVLLTIFLIFLVLDRALPTTS